MIGGQVWLRDDFRQVEVSLQLRGLIPILLASVAAFPPFWGLLQFVAVAITLILVLTVRIYEPRWGRRPRWLLTILLVAYIVERAFSLYRGGQIAVVGLSQAVAAASLLLYLMPPERGMTFMAVLLSLMTLVTSGMTRNDMSYIASLWGFVVFLPALLTMSSLHETVRADHLLWVRTWTGWRPRLAHYVRHVTRLALTLAAGSALYAVLPKPAVMPLARLGFENASNSFSPRQEIGRGPVAKGTTPFLEIEGEDAPYLVGQIFDRHENGAWLHTREKLRSRTSKEGHFSLPPFLDDLACAPRPPHAPPLVEESELTIRPLVGLPDLLLLPEGAREVKIGSWHLPGIPPYFVNVWPPESKEPYRVVVRHAARFPHLGNAHPTRPFTEPPHDVRQGDSKRFDFMGHVHETPSLEPRETEKLVDPTLDPRVITLAREITAGATTDVEKVQRILKFFSDGYVYDTRATTPETEAVVPYFLFVSKRGFCEHFATTTALMARAVGIPSRYVTGYMPQDIQKIGDRWIARVRPKDAHAWLQVHLAGHGWVPVDPTENLRSDSMLDTMEGWITGDPLAYGHASTWDLEMAREVMMSLSRSGSQVEDHLGEIVAGLVTGFALVGLIVWWRQKAASPVPMVRPVGEISADVREITAPAIGAREAARPPAGGVTADRGRLLELNVTGTGPGAGSATSLEVMRGRALAAYHDFCHTLAERGFPPRRADQTPVEYVRVLKEQAALAPLAARLDALARRLNRLAFGTEEGAEEVAAEIEKEASDLSRSPGSPSLQSGSGCTPRDS